MSTTSSGNPGLQLAFWICLLLSLCGPGRCVGWERERTVSGVVGAAVLHRNGTGNTATSGVADWAAAARVLRKEPVPKREAQQEQEQAQAQAQAQEQEQEQEQQEVHRLQAADLVTVSTVPSIVRAGQAFSVILTATNLGFQERIRIVPATVTCGGDNAEKHAAALLPLCRNIAQSECCGSPQACCGDTCLATAPSSALTSPGPTGDSSTSQLWKGVLLRTTGVFRTCWCSPLVGGRCDSALSFSVDVGEFTVLGPSGIVSAVGGLLQPPAGTPFHLQLLGTGMSLLDRIRILTANTSSCGGSAIGPLHDLSVSSPTVNPAKLSRGMIMEMPRTGSSGDQTTSLVWERVRVSKPGLFRVCWCSGISSIGPCDGSIQDAFIVDAGLFLALGPAELRVAPATPRIKEPFRLEIKGESLGYGHRIRIISAASACGDLGTSGSAAAARNDKTKPTGLRFLLEEAAAVSGQLFPNGSLLLPTTTKTSGLAGAFGTVTKLAPAPPRLQVLVQGTSALQYDRFQEVTRVLRNVSISVWEGVEISETGSYRICWCELLGEDCNEDMEFTVEVVGGIEVLPSLPASVQRDTRCRDSVTWASPYGEGCGWYSLYDSRCQKYTDLGQLQACPSTCFNCDNSRSSPRIEAMTANRGARIGVAWGIAWFLALHLCLAHMA